MKIKKIKMIKNVRKAEVKGAGRAEEHIKEQTVLKKTVIEVLETSKLKFVETAVAGMPQRLFLN